MTAPILNYTPDYASESGTQFFAAEAFWEGLTIRAVYAQPMPNSFFWSIDMRDTHGPNMSSSSLAASLEAAKEATIRHALALAQTYRTLYPEVAKAA